MNKLTNVLEKVMEPIAAALSNNKFLRSISNGLVMIMPFMLMASVFSIIQAIPGMFAFIPDWSEATSAALLIPYNIVFGLMALVISFTVAFKHAENYDLKPVSAGLISLLTFIIVSSKYENNAFDGSYLGYAGIFSAILVALVSTELYNFFKKHNLQIKLPDNVAEMVKESFAAFIPLTLIVAIFHLVNILCQKYTGVIFPALIAKAVTPALTATDTVGYTFLLHMFMQIFFWLGMHGWAILAGVMMPATIAWTAANAEAAAAGQALPYALGGSATMGVVHWFIPLMLMFLCKSKRNKAIGKATIIPALFGISEPYSFGIPVVLNPILAIPFIFYQSVGQAISVLAIKAGLQGGSSIMMFSGLPVPFSTFLAVNGDARVFLVFLVILVADIALWYPFLKVWDNKCLREEAAAEAAEKAK